MDLLDNPIIRKWRRVRTFPEPMDSAGQAADTMETHIREVNRALRDALEDGGHRRLTRLAALNWVTSLEYGDDSLVQECATVLEDVALAVGSRHIREFGEFPGIDDRGSTGIVPALRARLFWHASRSTAGVVRSKLLSEAFRLTKLASAQGERTTELAFDLHRAFALDCAASGEHSAALRHVNAALTLELAVYEGHVTIGSATHTDLPKQKADCLIACDRANEATPYLKAVEKRLVPVWLAADRGPAPFGSSQFAPVIETWQRLAALASREGGRASGIALLRDRIDQHDLTVCERGCALGVLAELTRDFHGIAAAEEVLESALARWGVAVAGLAGHARAKALIKVEQGWRANSADDMEAGLHLVAMLNCSVPLIQRRIDELSEQAIGEDAEADESFWRAVLALRRIAVMLYGRRLATDQDEWSGLPRGSYTAIAYDVGIASHRYINVHPYGAGLEAVASGHTVAEAIRELRSHLAGDDGNTHGWHVYLSFGESADDDLSALCSQLGAQYHEPERSIGDNWAPIWHQKGPRLDPLAAQVGLGAAATWFTTNVAVTIDGSDTPEIRYPAIASAWRALLRSALTGRPRIGYCQMPRGTATFLDHLLREGDPVETCDTFFMAQRKNKDTCGAARCRRYASRLVGLRAAMMDRAETIAEREWNKSSARGTFVHAWEEASQRGKLHPQDALRNFRTFLDEQGR